MLSVQSIEEAIQQLPEPDLTEFRRWFAQFNDVIWDKQIENDAQAGKLDHLAAEALAEYQNGQTSEI